jgi:hypothetical protein
MPRVRGELEATIHSFFFPGCFPFRVERSTACLALWNNLRTKTFCTKKSEIDRIYDFLFQNGCQKCLFVSAGRFCATKICLKNVSDLLLGALLKISLQIFFLKNSKNCPLEWACRILMCVWDWTIFSGQRSGKCVVEKDEKRTTGWKLWIVACVVKRLGLYPLNHVWRELDPATSIGVCHSRRPTLRDCVEQGNEVTQCHVFGMSLTSTVRMPVVSHYTVSSNSIGFYWNVKLVCANVILMCRKYETLTGSDCAKNSKRCWGCCVRLAIFLESNECWLGDIMGTDLHV